MLSESTGIGYNHRQESEAHRHVQTRARHNDRAYRLGLNIIASGILILIHILDLFFTPIP